jgi:hypothetical protein
MFPEDAKGNMEPGGVSIMGNGPMEPLVASRLLQRL